MLCINFSIFLSIYLSKFLILAPHYFPAPPFHDTKFPVRTARPPPHRDQTVTHPASHMYTDTGLEHRYSHRIICYTNC